MSCLAAFSALALFLMVADTRFQITESLGWHGAVPRAAWPALQPVEFRATGAVISSRFANPRFKRHRTLPARDDRDGPALLSEPTSWPWKTSGCTELLLELRDRLQTPALERPRVIYGTAGPYTRRVVLDQGQLGRRVSWKRSH